MMASKRVDLADDWNTVLDPDLNRRRARKGTNISSYVNDFHEFVARLDLDDKF